MILIASIGRDFETCIQSKQYFFIVVHICISGLGIVRRSLNEVRCCYSISRFSGRKYERKQLWNISRTFLVVQTSMWISGVLSSHRLYQRSYTDHHVIYLRLLYLSLFFDLFLCLLDYEFCSDSVIACVHTWYKIFKNNNHHSQIKGEVVVAV